MLRLGALKEVLEFLKIGNNIHNRILRVTYFFSLCGYLCVVKILYFHRYSLACVVMTRRLVTVRRTDYLTILCMIAAHSFYIIKTVTGLINCRTQLSGG